jgi:hypothetical protein
MMVMLRPGEELSLGQLSIEPSLVELALAHEPAELMTVGAVVMISTETDDWRGEDVNNNNAVANTHTAKRSNIHRYGSGRNGHRRKLSGCGT